MKTQLSSFLVGLIFALGLGLAGMTQPQKVIGFLNIFSQWDPSLLFVMGGALVTHSILYRLIRRRTSPLFASQWHVPTKTDLTPQLMVGAALFGLGWGLGGYCPAPAITSLASGSLKPFAFVGTMLIGMLMYRWVEKHLPWAR
jgi:uncharacterized membrane protein YedE/YeeE